MDEGADDGFERVPYQQNTSAIEIKQVFQPTKKYFSLIISYLVTL